MPLQFPCPACKRPQIVALTSVGNRWRCECGVETIVPKLPENAALSNSMASLQPKPPAVPDPLAAQRVALELERAKLEMERSALRRQASAPAQPSPPPAPTIDAQRLEVERLKLELEREKLARERDRAEEEPSKRKTSRRLRAGAAHGHTVVIAKNPGLAAVLAFFFPGVGHIYAGRIAFGLVYMVVVPLVAYAAMFASAASAMTTLERGHDVTEAGSALAGSWVLILTLACCAHVWQIFDAYNSASPSAPGATTRRGFFRRRRR